jgi:hypothetical protein
MENLAILKRANTFAMLHRPNWLKANEVETCGEVQGH